MSDFEAFKKRLEMLCHECGFMLCTTGYDLIVARKMDPGDPAIDGDIEEADW